MRRFGVHNRISLRQQTHQVSRIGGEQRKYIQIISATYIHTYILHTSYPISGKSVHPMAWRRRMSRTLLLHIAIHTLSTYMHIRELYVTYYVHTYCSYYIRIVYVLTSVVVVHMRIWVRGLRENWAGIRVRLNYTPCLMFIRSLRMTESQLTANCDVHNKYV